MSKMQKSKKDMRKVFQQGNGLTGVNYGYTFPKNEFTPYNRSLEKCVYRNGGKTRFSRKCNPHLLLSKN